MQRLGAAALLVAAFSSALALLGWQATRSDDVPFLVSVPPAAWVTYPHAPSFGVRARVELETLFERRFELATKPAQALLFVRTYRAGELSINGKPVPFAATSGEGWKQARAGDVASLLRAGPNVIRATVRTEVGPPALWLALDAGGERIVSDTSWSASLMGAEDAPVRLAREPMSHWARAAPDPVLLARVNPRPADALARHALALAALFAGAALVAGGIAFALRGATQLSPGASLAAWSVVAAVWVALFVNNRDLHGAWGFDPTGHHDYITMILRKAHLPLANEGFQMYQPPLYYLMAAGLLKLGGFAGIDQGAIEWLRWLGCATGLAQAAFVLLALRELFPARPGLVLCAFGFGAFLPVSVYLAQFVTNENLVAALSSGALWWTIRMLRRPESGLRDWAVLGGFLGLAMLTKFSALVPLALCTALLTARWLLDGRGSPTALLARLGTTLAVVLAIAGWHYARVALHFEGNPFVGNWDTATRYIWWQDPGYHVLADYTRFGAVLERPLMSSTASVLDALYATLFGDGLISGSGFPEVTPPWRLDWMALGYGVALVPCAVLLVGVALAFVDFVRQPRSERLLLVGVLGATGFLLLSLTLRLPYYAQAKAFYAMSALVPLAFCFALGFDALALRSRVLAPLGVTWLAGWIAVTLVTFAAPAERLRENPMVAVTQVDRGGFLAQANLAMAEGRRDEAIGALREALALDPDQARLGVALVKLLIAAGRPDEALAAARATLRVDPYDQSLHRIAAKLWREQGAQRRASRHLAWAERLGRVGVGH